MTKQEKENFEKQLFQLYFEDRLHHTEVSKILGIPSDSVLYYTSKTGFTRASYLRYKYDKSFIEQKLINNSYESVAKELNLTLGEFRVLVKNHDIKTDITVKYLKNKVNDSFYCDKKFEKEFYYFVGLFASDGGFHGKSNMRINIKNKGAEKLLTQLANCAGHDNVKSYKNDFFELNFDNVGLKNKLLEIGIPNFKKTYNLKDIFVPNKDALYSFLCGLMDGDGSVKSLPSKFGYRVSLTYEVSNYNLEFLENLAIKIKSMIGFNTNISKKGSISAIYIGSRNGSKEFFKSMYEISPFKLECKYQKYLDIINKVMI